MFTSAAFDIERVACLCFLLSLPPFPARPKAVSAFEDPDSASR